MTLPGWLLGDSVHESWDASDADTDRKQAHEHHAADPDADTEREQDHARHAADATDADRQTTCS